ncbi:MAG: hypothetical protein FVQ80_09610 [Planctomycetes bacterium]|nr:hypothetical protein [Planctomycetota bacterium]
MYPDNHYDANGVLKSGNRKDTQLTADQRNKMRLGAVPFAHDAMDNGRGGEVYDDARDVSNNYIDLHWAQLWIEWIGGRYIFHMTAQVDVPSFVYPSEIGFYIESDNDETTGQPPEGLDYYLAFQPHSGQIIFMQYNPDCSWMPSTLPPEAITHELTYAHSDSTLAPVPIGVQMDLDIELLIPGQTLTGSFAFKATATNYTERDLAPNTGMLRYSYPPIHIPGDLNIDNKVNGADLQIMMEQWLETGILRADIYPVSGDGVVQFSDFAVMANNWMVEIIP